MGDIFTKVNDNTVSKVVHISVDDLKSVVDTAKSNLNEQTRQLEVITTEYQGRVDKAQVVLDEAQKALDEALATGAKLSTDAPAEEIIQ